MPDVEICFQHGGVATEVVIGQIGSDVVQAVDRTEFGEGRVDQVFDRLFISEVEFDRYGASALASDLLYGRLLRRLC